MLGYILVLVSLALGILSGSDLPGTAGYFLEGLTAWNTLQLLAVVTLIEMLTVFMQLNGSLHRILAALRRVVDDSRVLIALVPSLLGLLPMPGGAMLSAPMVGTYGEELKADADHKATINLFFRHVWDLTVPFKPHVILAAAMFNMPLFTFIGWQLPSAAVAFLAGYWYLVGRKFPPASAGPAAQPSQGEGRPLWIEVMPLALPMALSLGLGIDFVYTMAAGLLFGVLTQRTSGAALKKMVLGGVHPRMLFLLASIMIFKTVVDRTGVVGDVAAALASLGVPLEILAVALPGILVFVVGVEIAGIGIVFPLLLAMLPEGAPVLPYALAMSTANAVAQTLSPVHACMVMGNEYYGAGAARVLRLSLFPQIVRLAVGLALAWGVATYA